MFASYAIAIAIPVRSGVSDDHLVHGVLPALKEAHDGLDPVMGEVAARSDSEGGTEVVIEAQVDEVKAEALVIFHDTLAETAFRVADQGLAVPFQIAVDDDAGMILLSLMSTPERFGVRLLNESDPTRVSQNGVFFVGPDDDAIRAAWTIHRQNHIADFLARELDLDKATARDLADAGAAITETPNHSQLIAMHREDTDSDGDAEEAMWIPAAGQSRWDGKALMQRNRRLAAEPGYQANRDAIQASGAMPEDHLPLSDPDQETFVDALPARELIRQAALLYRDSPMLSSENLARFEAFAQSEGQTAAG